MAAPLAAEAGAQILHGVLTHNGEPLMMGSDLTGAQQLQNGNNTLEVVPVNLPTTGYLPVIANIDLMLTP